MMISDLQVRSKESKLGVDKLCQRPVFVWSELRVFFTFIRHCKKKWKQKIKNMPQSVAYKTKNNYFLVLYRKNLPTSDLNYRHIIKAKAFKKYVCNYECM